MNLQSFIDAFIPSLETTMKKVVAKARYKDLAELHEILTYHLGWEEGLQSTQRGKRIRPMLLMLTAASVGGDWRSALPAAAAVELVHNFSLIHDDIEDNSLLRRGRATIWKKWNLAKAINSGDALFALSHIALNDLPKSIPATGALKIHELLMNACLRLTQGQHLDIIYESQGGLSLDSYWPMISGKTAALISASTEIGALIGDADSTVQEKYRLFGEHLGLAFQVQDDYLGVWGQSRKTGKSTQSDLLSGKKSLPILYALGQGEQFARRWTQGAITPEEVPTLTRLLEEEGAKNYTLETTNDLTQKSLTALRETNPQGDAGEALLELAKWLLTREK
jgi:geranylgeranyl diphosphate synthase type I